MAKNQQAIAAKAFAERWKGKGYEKGESQSFWIELLQTVLGVERPFDIISFENQVKLNNTSFIDAYIAPTRVLIEQKSIEKDLHAPIKQSSGELLTPFQQAKRYAMELPVSKHPRWVVTSNFKSFLVYDMEHPQSEPEEILLENLEKEYYRLQFLVDNGNEHLKREIEVSLQAGQIIGEIYEELRKQYINPDDPETLRCLNVLCVRLVFCLYCEDAGVFGKHSMFHDYLIKFKPGEGDMREAVIKLFEVLNTPYDKRDPYLRDDLAAFPYCSGGLFADMHIEVPRFNDKIATLLLKNASDDFDWSEISPTIFGAVFESTLNPETRRSSGMHYTSIENIHKVIDPLFLDELKEELAAIKEEKVDKIRIKKAVEYQDKLASLKFLDPACGSGNFLTETYISLRRLENEAIAIQSKGQMYLGFDGDFSPIKVDINQFYGIEINDFAVATATTALWIAESQMMMETEKIISSDLEFLPLNNYDNIHEGNALRMDWNDVVPASELNYIMGNPPFVGARLMSESQKNDVLHIFGKKWKNVGNLDYVCCWYMKAASIMKSTNKAIRTALVSTNSISQGEQVAALWSPLFNDDIHIDYAYRTFRWDSEANIKAHVHCVIIGFSIAQSNRHKIIYNSDTSKTIAQNINGYLVDGPNVGIDDRNSPLSDVPNMVFGSMPNDGGFLSDYSPEEHDVIVKKYPEAEHLFKKIIGATEFINNKERWCLWLKNVSPSLIRGIPPIAEAVQKVREMRESSTRESTRKLAEIPTLFGEIRQPDSNYLIVPRVSSENRRYVPMGFLTKDVIASDSVQMVPRASLFTFGILTSNVHMAWMRTVCGRLKSDYRYSAKIVYNNFSWPTPTGIQREKIERTAQAIIDARDLYPGSSLADLYDEVTMPPELRKAHQENDKAVMEAYGFDWRTMTESECVTELLKLYQELTK